MAKDKKFELAFQLKQDKSSSILFSLPITIVNSCLHHYQGFFFTHPPLQEVWHSARTFGVKNLSFSDPT
jgi:hypothetical protein